MYVQTTLAELQSGDYSPEVKEFFREATQHTVKLFDAMLFGWSGRIPSEDEILFRWIEIALHSVERCLTEKKNCASVEGGRLQIECVTYGPAEEITMTNQVTISAFIRYIV